MMGAGNQMSNRLIRQRCPSDIFFIFFYLYLPSFAFSSLHLPSLVKVPKGFFWAIFGRPARAAWGGRSRLRPGGGEIDCANVSHTRRMNHSV
jgi:hypothetical protein